MLVFLLDHRRHAEENAIGPEDVLIFQGETTDWIAVRVCSYICHIFIGDTDGRGENCLHHWRSADSAVMDV